MLGLGMVLQLLGLRGHMSTTPVQELDRLIQLSLVISVRRAANAHKAEPADPFPESLKTYLSALESLAEYVSAKWRGERAVPEIKAARQRIGVRPISTKDESGPGIGPFVPLADEGDNAKELNAA